MTFLRAADEWLQAFSCFRYCEVSTSESISMAANVPSPTASGQCQPLHIFNHTKFVCDVCNEAFSNAKAALAHKRAKHGLRVEQRYYSNNAGLCQVCGTVFHTHARLLRHLTDKRRTTCWTAICNNAVDYTRLHEAQVEELDTWYREQKMLAWEAGNSHVLAVKPARTCSGKMIGHVRR